MSRSAIFVELLLPLIVIFVFDEFLDLLIVQVAPKTAAKIANISLLVAAQSMLLKSNLYPLVV